MHSCNLYRLKSYSLVIIFVLALSFYAQSQSNQDIYIERKLEKIDSLIVLKQYDKAVILINNTQNTFTFRANDENKLAFDYRYALVTYESGDKNKGLEKFLNGFEKIKLHPNSSLYVKYVNFLSKIFASSQNFNRALYYNKIAVINAKLNKDTVNLIRTYNRMGSFYFAINKIDSAKFFFRKAVYSNFSVNEKTEEKLAKAFNNLGVIAEMQNNFPLAKNYALKSIEIEKKRNDSLGMARAILILGNLFFEQNDYRQAIKLYYNANNLVNERSDAELVFKKAIYDNLSVAYDSIGDFKQAYQYLLKYKDLNKEITNNIFNKNIAETEAKYNLAKEEQKTEEERNKVLRTQFLFYGLAFVTLTFFILILIFYKNYKLRQQNKLEQIHSDIQTRIINATVEAKEKERKNIAEILHDSVSALLSSANLHLQASKTQLNSKFPVEITKAQQIVTEASGKIRDLSHNLISSVLLKFGLALAVHDLCEKYSNSEFSLTSDESGISRYNQKFEIKIYNIIEELINNVIKHSKAKNATINLVERNGDKLIIQIIDDGQGFDVKKARNKNGLGLSHIEARIKVMNGVFNINSKKGEGTSIFISAPIYISEKIDKV